jgi:calcineurin-like phosphoesterase family protein
MIFFTSDHHFSHANVIKYSNRPFSSVEQMDEELIKRWNEVVSKGDTVYHLGDFTLGDDAKPYISRLHGRIRFVTTSFHHDARWIKNAPASVVIDSLVAIEHGKEMIILCHYPIAVWDRQHYGSWHLYGHIHNKDFVLPGFSMNVNVEFHNYYPVSYLEVKRHMIGLGWYPGWKAEFVK